jgi:hypothetical protein
MRIGSVELPICIESFTNRDEAIEKAEGLWNVENAYSVGSPSDDYTVYEFNPLDGERIVWMNGKEFVKTTN